MSRPAPEEPPIIDTIRLGVMAMHRVTKFLIHVFILRFKKPYKKKKKNEYTIEKIKFSSTNIPSVLLLI